MKKGSLRTVRLIAVMLILSFSWQATPLYASGTEKNAIYRVGTGYKGSPYYEFGGALQDMSQKSEMSRPLVNIVTAGSLDSLARVERRELDGAIVQNDVAYYTDSGKYGFPEYSNISSAIPLFLEYVQIVVRKDSDIHILGDLKNKVIGVGPSNSGSYRNALTILREIGYRDGVDYDSNHDEINVALEKLAAGRLDALIFTSAMLDSWPSPLEGKFRHIGISRDISAELSSRYPYYEPETVRIAGQRHFMLGVTAWLVFRSDLSAQAANDILALALDNWKQLEREKSYRLLRLKEALLRPPPVPFHDAAQALLEKRGYLESNSVMYLMAGAGILLISLVWWARSYSGRYDRLGNAEALRSSWGYRIAGYVDKGGTYLVIVAAFFLLAVVLVELIRYFETEFAREMNIDNAFANIDFIDALLWMFVFMGAGEPSGMFPQTMPGKILATALPFVGVWTILVFVFTTVDRRRDRIAASKRGKLLNVYEKHVLICGWNEKVPGIIFALTSPESPERKHIVVIAEIEGDMPLEKYNFDPRLVSYCRGDSADYAVLKHACADQAEAAIVVAGFRKRRGRNKGSILSVMALRKTGERGTEGAKQRKDLFIAAEMVYSENKRLFEACGANAVVNSDDLVNRAIALCALAPHLIDFLLDMLTHDEFSEIYSIRADDLEEQISKGFLENRVLGRQRSANNPESASGSQSLGRIIGRPFGEVASEMIGVGINPIGLCFGRDKRAISLENTFRDNMEYALRTEGDHKGRVIDSEAHIIFLADNYWDVHKSLRNRKAFRRIEDSTGECGHVSEVLTPKEMRVVLVGSYDRIGAVALLLKAVSWIDVVAVTAGDCNEIDGQDNREEGVHRTVYGEFDDPNTWAEAGLETADVVMILTTSLGELSETDLLMDKGDVDADAILLTSLIRRYHRERAGAKAVKVVAELINPSSRRLFEDAGADFVLPTNLLIERVLTKLVFSKGVVCDLLLALMAIDDGVHIWSITVDGDSLTSLVGATFEGLLRSAPSGMQIVGVLPINDREKYKNAKGDFGYHYMVTPGNASDREYKISAGDEIIVILDRRAEEGTGSRPN